MVEELKPSIRLKAPQSIQECLNRIDVTQLRKESSIQKNSGKTSMITGSQTLIKTQLKNVGKGRGIVGSGQLSNGEIIDHEIKMNAAGLPLMPQLTEQEWQLIDREISTEDFDNPVRYGIELDGEKRWMPFLIQGEAAMRVAPPEPIIIRLTRLRTLKPTQNMTTEQNAVFFGDLTEILREEGFCYTAIDEGIKNLVKREEDKWFPGPEKLIKYIYPIHWKMKKRFIKLNEILSRERNSNE